MQAFLLCARELQGILLAVSATEALRKQNFPGISLKKQHCLLVRPQGNGPNCIVAVKWSPTVGLAL